MRELITPNAPVAVQLEETILVGYFLIAGLLWIILPSKIIPSPWEVVKAFPGLWDSGLGVELWTSMTLYFQAVLITTLFSLGTAYGAALPIMRPFAAWVSVARFNGFVGLSLLLTLLIGDPHWIKVALLVIGMSVFTVPAIVASINAIPADAYDHARTLGMGEWRVLLEVVIVGRFHEVLDILRTNFSMGWMLLPMVEGLFRGERGLGVMLLEKNKYFQLEAVYAIVVFICLIGLAQDFVIVRLKHLLCPYAFLGMERT